MFLHGQQCNIVQQYNTVRVPIHNRRTSTMPMELFMPASGSVDKAIEELVKAIIEKLEDKS